MTKTSSFILAFATLFTWNSIEAHQQDYLKWYTSYEEAVIQSQATAKPILLFFTGSDWCAWCHKLENEVFNTKEFSDITSDKFIFVKIDFHLNSALSPNLGAQNKQLQKKFDVQGFPAVIILDAQSQKQIGCLGYLAGGGKDYATRLFNIVTDYLSYKTKVQNLENQKLSGKELKGLYEKANEFGLENDAYKIMKLGMSSDESRFFSVERYRFLAEEGRIHVPEAISLKQKLIASDPKNDHLTHYQIAIIDFEACCEEKEKEQYSVESNISPLVNYIEKFGSNDKTHLWRLQMIVSQVYFDNNNLKEALKYAQASYQSAPTSVQGEIATAVRNIQLRLQQE
jgi:protein disulfide-isomerase